MKKSVFFSVLIVLLCAPGVSSAKKSSDPVVMTVGGKPVPLSEFEYLYKKNNEQQSQTTSLDEYVGMFVNYKLKVLAACDAGLDTTSTFKTDFEQYRQELAQPYMRNKAVDDSLLHVAYNHMLENVSVSHILLPSRTKDGAPTNNRALMDSLRSAIIGGADFADVARRYSADPTAKTNGGNLGYVPVGVLPYAFEDMAYATPAGELSPVFETSFGLHLIKVNDRRQDPGQVKVRHILKLTRGLDEAAAKVKKTQIDSIYQVLKAGADFVEVAKIETDDPSGRKSGGDLPWFGAGRMVPEFEKVAFALSDNEMSEPVKSLFGYHIILREGHKGAATFDEVKKSLEENLARDSRSRMAVDREVSNFRKLWKAKADTKARKQVLKVVQECGGMNAAARERLSSMTAKALTVGKQSRTVSDVAAMMEVADSVSVDEVMNCYDATVDAALNDITYAEMFATLPDRHPDYRNLINEYRDGILLYEISNEKVWNRANTDRAGLQACFEAHRADFKWSKPHYKGFIVAAANDSIADAAVAYLTDSTPNDDDLVTTLRKQFGTDAKIERVIAGKGDNAVVDYVAFGAQQPAANGRWKSYRQYKGKVIEQPEEALDVKGAVSMLYQQELEDAWIEELHNRYDVEIDQKVLQSVK